MYKGYIETKNKQAKQKFKDAELKTLAQVEALEEYAGVLADDYILVDIDDPDQSEIMMNIVEAFQIDCKVTITTRGRHFVMKNDGSIKKNETGTQLTCGLKADIKLGSRNSYQVLKFDGEERFIEWDASEYQEIPAFMKPLKTSISIFNLEEGDGRNSSLFEYILVLTKNGYSKEETRQILRIINKFVLKNPLSENELETVMRDDAFPEDLFFDGSQFLFNQFAEFLKNNEHIRRINGQLHIYNDGIYTPGYQLIEVAMLKHIPFLRSAQRTEVLKYLELICVENTTLANANLIAFFNGIYDLTTNELRPFTPRDIVTNRIPWKYDPNAYNQLADKTLNKLAVDDPKIRALLEECIGYCFYRRNELSTAFFLTGEKSNGKSTFLDMVKYTLGEENTTALDLEEMDERFSVATLSGKLANIGDDISDEFLSGRTLATFKKIVSGNQIKAEYKGHDAFFFQPYVKLLFSANDIPRMKDKTGAVLRRMVIVPFNARFSKEDPDFDPYITWKLKTREVAQYLINIGLEGLKRVLENKRFTESDKVAEEIERYEVENNPVLLFIEDSRDEIQHEETKDVHRRYQIFCIDNGFKSMTLAGLSKEISRHLGYAVVRRRINGKLVSFYE